MSHRDIVLSPEEAQKSERYRKSFGDEWVERALDASRARIYREKHLEKVEGKSNSSSPYRCYSQGTTVYRRKDGEPVTQADIDAVDANVVGQGHTVIAKPGDQEITHKWFVDSSD